MDGEDKLLFLVSVIEEYREKHNIKGEEAHRILEEREVIDYVIEFHDVLHTMSIESVVEEIEEMIKEG